MKASFINPFLSSSIHVIETVIQVRPTIGELRIREIDGLEDYIWLRIGIMGQMEKDILFGFPEPMALIMVSRMMGGSIVTEFNELCQSAVAELGNMISGNASTMLYNEGIVVDITPPHFVSDASAYKGGKAFNIPFKIETVGEFHINIMV